MQKNILVAFIYIVVSCFFFQKTTAQTAKFKAYLLTPPAGHNCKGVIRFEYKTCSCLTSFGIDTYVNGNGSWCGAGNNCVFASCDKISYADFQFLPGEYDIVGEVTQSAGCSNTGKKFKYHVSIPNPPCKMPTLSIDSINASSGFNCADGKVTAHVYPNADCSAGSGSMRIEDTNGNTIAWWTGNWFDPDPWGHTFSLKAGKYILKAWNNGECNDTAIKTINIPGPKKCRKPSLQITDKKPASGPNCADGKFTAHVYPNGSCGADAGRINVYDSLGNQVASFYGYWFENDSWGKEFTGFKAGKYTIKAWTNTPGCFDTAYQTIQINEKKCIVTLTEVSRQDSIGGIFCPDVNKIELKFTASACYNNWYLTETTSQLFGQEGSWAAAKDQTVKASLIELKKASDKYQFVAHIDNLTCVAKYQPSGFKSKGCDAAISANLVSAESSPGANDGAYEFTINTSACTDYYGNPWIITLKNLNTGESSVKISNDRKMNFGGLSGGTYSISFGDHASVCSYKDAKVINVPTGSGVSRKNNLIANVVTEKWTATLAPNPAQHTSTLFMSNSSTSVNVYLTDLSGKVLWQRKKVTTQSLIIPLHNIRNGTYLVVADNSRQKKTLKLLKADN